MTDMYHRLGLAKSLFLPKIFEPLPPEYYIPYVSEIFNILRYRRIRPKLYQMMDVFMSFYKPYQTIMSSVKHPEKHRNIWQRILYNFITTQQFQRLNAVTSGSETLSILASVRFFERLVKYVDPSSKEISSKLSPDVVQKTDELFQKLMQNRELILLEIKEEIKEFKEMQEEAIEIAQMIAGAGGHGYTHEALSVWEYLKDPDTFRKKISIMRNLWRYLRKFSTSIPTAMMKEQMVSPFGGIYGVGVIQDPRQIQDLHITEHVLPFEIFALRLLSQQSLVMQRATAIKPVVFIDKSGSMAEKYWGDLDAEKIAVACGFGLALHRHLNAEIYLFDTEVEKVSPKDVVRTLLTLRAGGGTSITGVLEEIKRIGKTTYNYIVITDGIDYVDDQLAKEVSSKFRVTFIVIPPASYYDWLTNYFRYIVAKDPRDFLRAL